MHRVDIKIVKELRALALQNKEPDTPEQTEAKILAGKIIGLVQNGRTMANNWGFYLFSEELDSEPQLRNKITTIMISGLMDTLEGEQRVLDEYKAEAEKNGYVNMVAWCVRTKEYCGAVQEVLNLFTKEEQIFIRSIRDQLVHGWVANPHREKISVKYFNGQEIVSEQMEREEYDDHIKVPLLDVIDGNIVVELIFEDVLTKFTEKFVNPNLNYWKIVNKLNSKGFMDAIYKAIYSDIGVDWTPEFSIIPKEPE